MKETKNTEKTEDTPALELLPGELPALEVNKLKAQHGKVYRIETAHNGERLVGYFKKPDRKVLGGLHHLTSLLLGGFGPGPAAPLVQGPKQAQGPG
jgi:hypothetical protein